MICVAALCRTSSSPLLKLNTTMTYKIGTKALSAILDAIKLIRFPPIDSCLEYDPNDYSNLDESKAGGLSYSPIKVHVLIWQFFIDCRYLAYVVLHFFYFVAPHLLSLLIIYVEMPCPSIINTYSIYHHTMFSTQMLFLCIRYQKGRG